MNDQPDAVAVDGYAQMQTETLLNLASPQPTYREMIEQGGMASPGEGMVMVFTRELNDFVLRHHERLDGTGYHRYAKAPDLSPAARADILRQPSADAVLAESLERVPAVLGIAVERRQTGKGPASPGPPAGSRGGRRRSPGPPAPDRPAATAAAGCRRRRAGRWRSTVRRR